MLFVFILSKLEEKIYNIPLFIFFFLFFFVLFVSLILVMKMTFYLSYIPKLAVILWYVLFLKLMINSRYEKSMMLNS